MRDAASSDRLACPVVDTLSTVLGGAGGLGSAAEDIPVTRNLEIHKAGAGHHRF